MSCYLGFVFISNFLQMDLNIEIPEPGQMSDQLSYLFIATKTASPGQSYRQFNYLK